MTDDRERAASDVARGPSPGEIIARRHASPAPGPTAAAPPDPLRLCVYATIAALGWLLGPVALAIFAVVAFIGYAAAWRAGLRVSRCWLRDTRLVLLYLALLAAVALGAMAVTVIQWIG
ncbi:hypothetical protein GCM10022200_08330 [Microbacterium awajiense]|uniref:Uncharacterized protein n=1 Tax=Microbacterium awajiense TaxID=415214 RepID=A0ABP7AAH5_9MICO